VHEQLAVVALRELGKLAHVADGGGYQTGRFAVQDHDPDSMPASLAKAVAHREQFRAAWLSQLPTTTQARGTPMAKFSFLLNSPVAPDRFLAALVDFTDKRIETWPTIDPSVFRVHSTSGTSAEATEGSVLFGGIWGRERYDWSTPGVVRITLMESNVGRPGGVWEYHISPGAGGGSHMQMVYDRKSKGLKGRCLGALLQVIGGKPFEANLKRTLDILAAT
jgi:hypothetical protein